MIGNMSLPPLHHSGVTRWKPLTFYVRLALEEMRRQAFVAGRR
jgi:hypothetical protein